jgi:cell division protein FtsB
LFRGITITHCKLPLFKLALMAWVVVSFCLAGISLIVQDQVESRARANSSQAMVLKAQRVNAFVVVHFQDTGAAQVQRVEP